MLVSPVAVMRSCMPGCMGQSLDSWEGLIGKVFGFISDLLNYGYCGNELRHAFVTYCDTLIGEEHYILVEEGV